MNARRIFAAAAIAIATATGAACSGGGSPTLADAGNDPPIVPTPEPTDTSGFVPPMMLP